MLNLKKAKISIKQRNSQCGDQGIQCGSYYYTHIREHQMSWTAGDEILIGINSFFKQFLCVGLQMCIILTIFSATTISVSSLNELVILSPSNCPKKLTHASSPHFAGSDSYLVSIPATLTHDHHLFQGSFMYMFLPQKFTYS